ncbi:hypothetical protein CPU12_02210 [Malaciobacter molluscorum LMG 25693]|uniref:FlaG family protein n=1 Tax=Malaciobacter molluscorum LMG 25693 TaxID=870501 RepID=A0A2G1DKQ3_9BACT|nr:hypothetical protein [Malaciobacter molluscorum]AXX92660.1 FlaG family protein [Malaciobacter molluscorum LMG 25693]PHO19082.1 hypothetical protein CPU12_02210 [Malaciobacter molluscorum LMG 25693]RXJ97388.1 hypothetical protein CRV00_00695 [Malaciobacter molluscorum]
MEYGVMPKLEAYSSEQIYKAQTVQPSSATSQVIEGKNSKEISKEEFSKISESKEVKTKKEDVDTSNIIEFTLTNLNFGYNSNSRDFYVKAIRGESENQYPTDEMMKLKAFLLKLSQSET